MNNSAITYNNEMIEIFESKNPFEEFRTRLKHYPMRWYSLCRWSIEREDLYRLDGYIKLERTLFNISNRKGSR